MSAEEHAEPLAYANAFNLQLFSHPTVSLDELGGASLSLSKNFRTLALLALLEHGDTERFHQNLQRSGQVRRYYLQRAQDTEPLLFHQATGRAQPVFDAIAANDFGLARDIADLSTRTFHSKFEYEDDFCIAQLVQLLAKDPVPVADTIPVLEQFENYLDGENSAMFDTLSSLVDQDADAFAEAFENLLIEYAVYIQEQEALELDSVEHTMRRQIYVEGLALLRLATRFQLKTEADYQFCPRIARGILTQPFVPLID